MFAPIVVFAFNRLDVLKNTINSLIANLEAKDSDLFIFIDGPRKTKNGESEKVESVINYSTSISGFRKISVRSSVINIGLAESIIGGVSEIIELYGKIIVVEDDLYLSPYFLNYMNRMLDIYEGDERILQVSGFGTFLGNVKYPYDIYLNKRATSWAWATWRDRWYSIDWEVKDFDFLSKDYSYRHTFNKECGSDMFGMLKGFMEKKNNSWAVRFSYSMFKQNRYTISPVQSYVRNDGFDANGTNCVGYNRFRVDFNNTRNSINIPQSLEFVPSLNKRANRYWNLFHRFNGKIHSMALFKH